MPDTYEIGDEITFAAVFADSDGTETDPSDVYFRWRDPAGVETSYHYGVDPELTRTGTGAYEAWLRPLVPGIWYRRWASVEPVPPHSGVHKANEVPFTVRETAFESP